MNKTKKFVFIDIVYIVMMLLPILACIVLKVLFTPEGVDEISITGALVFLEIPAPVQPIQITEAQVNSLAVLISLFFLCRFLTHGLSEKAELKRQHICEMIIEATDNLVKTNMHEYFSFFSPFVAAIMGLSAFSSLLSLCGLFPPTSDINIVGGWALIVFILITYYKFKAGPIHYVASFFDPAPLAPLNIISEFATPVSMAFRHYGNVLSGSVISVLVAAGLGGLSNIILNFLPSSIYKFPILRVGLPAVLSVYFDVFSGLLQAFIFAMLTMLYVSGGFPAEDYFKRKAKKLSKKNNKQTI